MSNKTNRKISVIIPVYNEANSLKELYLEILSGLNECFYENLANDYELWFVNDGSDDQSKQIIEELSLSNHKIHIVNLKTHSGKSIALNEAFKNVKGEIVFTIDADLQDDPKEFPKLVKKLDEGYGLVVGWRKFRADSFGKIQVSKLYNHLYSLIFHTKIHDHDCGLKCFDYEAIRNLELYGGLHRYLPSLVEFKGFKVTEIVVEHRKRKYGKTKYNLLRYFECVRDLILVRKIQNRHDY